MIRLIEGRIPEPRRLRPSRRCPPTSAPDAQGRVRETFPLWREKTSIDLEEAAVAGDVATFARVLQELWTRSMSSSSRSPRAAWASWCAPTPATVSLQP